MVRTRVGYAGGTTDGPTYGNLGDHSEAIEVDYDPQAVSYDDLLDVFWRGHDARRPTYSVQYRSAIFYRTVEEHSAAERSLERIEASLGRVRTAIEPLRRFWLAEDYHQKFRLRSRPSVLSEFRHMYPDRQDFIDSTAAARVNGWLDGCGDPERVDELLPLTGLSQAAQDEVRSHQVPRRFASAR